MEESFRQCPKCGHVLPQATPASAQCSACGIYFFKWGQVPAVRETHEQEAPPSWRERLLSPMPAMDSLSFYGRSLALALLAWWSWSLVRADYRDGEMFDSFMHNILLPIHEAGHVFLMPFGEFMTILGGSLFQLALPLGIAIAFAVRNRDNFAAALGIWWTSVSLLDLSPYIYDSLHPRLTMLGGHTGEDGPHDWIYLLDVFRQLHRAQAWGAAAHAIGSVCVVIAIVWATAVLWRQKAMLHDQV